MDLAASMQKALAQRLTVPSLMIVSLFTIAALASAYRKPLASGFDEIAHLSYVTYVQTAGSEWPRFAEMRMLDPETFRFGSEPNYLNHPPFYYWLMATLAPNVTGNRSSLVLARGLNVAIAAFGVAVLLLWGRRMRFDRPQFYAFAIMVASTPVLAPLAGSVNNDNLAFFGGAIALYGLYVYATRFDRLWLIVACCGLIVAGTAKLTGLLLVGSTLVLTLALLSTLARISLPDLLIASLGLAIAASPYLAFILQYGSPAPNTVGQDLLLTSGASTAGWADAPRMAPLDYAGFFLKSFLMNWMPSLRPRETVQLSLLALPAAVVLISLAGYGVSLRALLNRNPQPQHFIVTAGMSAIVLTLAIHIAFSYHRHLQTGWQMDAYPRYYLPLIAIIPIAALAASSAVPQHRLRTGLISFLVAAPIIFALFGAPLA